MDKKAGYAFRIVLGGYLAYLGIRILIQMSEERPSNMVFMCVMAVIFTVIGCGYAIYSLKKVWDMRKEGTAAADSVETEELAAEDLSPNTDVRPIDIKKAGKAPDGTPEEPTEAALKEPAEAIPEEKIKTMPQERVETSPEKQPDEDKEETAEELEEEIENDYEEK